jgi:hypothetical protein
MMTTATPRFGCSQKPSFRFSSLHNTIGKGTIQLPVGNIQLPTLTQLEAKDAFALTESSKQPEKPKTRK